MDRERARKIADEGDLTVKTAYAIADLFVTPPRHGAPAPSACVRFPGAGAFGLLPKPGGPTPCLQNAAMLRRYRNPDRFAGGMSSLP